MIGKVKSMKSFRNKCKYSDSIHTRVNPFQWKIKSTGETARDRHSS